MNTMMANLVDTLLAKEQLEKIEETNEPITTKEILGVGNSMNMLSVIYNVDRKSDYHPLVSEAPPKQLIGCYNLMRKGHISEYEIKKHLLHKILPPSNPTPSSQNEPGSVPSSKNTSTNNKNKSTTPKVVDKATSLDSST